MSNKVVPVDPSRPKISVDLVSAAILELDFLQEADNLKEYLTNPDILKIAIYR